MAKTGGLLAGQWALVTGGSRGIGAVIAEKFASEGASLCLAARSTDKLEETAKACKAAGAPDVEVYSIDLTSSSDIDKMCKTMLGKHKVQILVNCAGMATFNEAPYESDADKMDKMVDLNLKTPAGPHMRLCHHLSGPMVEDRHGTIIDIASIAGVDAVSSQPAYSATKWGLHGWSDWLRRGCQVMQPSLDQMCVFAGALRDKGIKVCCLAPGYVDSEMPPEGMKRESMIKASDVATMCMMPFQLSVGCIPQLVVLRNAEILD